MKKNEYGFHLISINTKEYGEQIYNIYFALKNGRSEANEILQSVKENDRDRIIDLISRMATVRNYQSKQITWRLKEYPYGEIKPHPHRFFFFQIHGNNIIIFAYKEKKKNSLKDTIYKEIDREREIYAQKFRETIKRS